MRRPIAWLILFAALAADWSGSAFGQSNDDRRVGREREMLRRLQEQTRKAEQEKAVLAAEVEALKKKLKGAEQGAARSGKRVRDTGKALAMSEQRNAALMVEKVNLSESVDQLQESLKDVRAELAKMEQKLLESTAALDRSEHAGRMQKTDLDRAQSIIVQRDREIGACEAKNLRLYEYSVDLLGRYEGKGILEVIRQKEPLTGLKAVEIENLLEEYRDKLDDQKIESGRPRASADVYRK
jgi:chromosome segregation ATPase